jgi:hypothetical protein
MEMFLRVKNDPIVKKSVGKDNQPIITVICDHYTARKDREGSRGSFLCAVA